MAKRGCAMEKNVGLAENVYCIWNGSGTENICIGCGDERH